MVHAVLARRGGKRLACYALAWCILALLCPAGPFAPAPVYASGGACTIPTNSFSVTCAQASAVSNFCSGHTGPNTNQPYQEIPAPGCTACSGSPISNCFAATTAGNTVYVQAYNCWNSNCNGTGSTTMSVSTSSADPDTNCALSPQGILTLNQGTGGQIWQEAQWMCPNEPSISWIKVNICPSSTPNCSTAQASATGNYVTLFDAELGGMASSSIWDIDGAGASNGSTGNSGSTTTTTWSNSTGQPATPVLKTKYTNELCITEVDTVNDETMSAGTGTTLMEQPITGNALFASVTGSTSVQVTHNFTWASPADYYGGIIGCAKSAASTPLAGTPPPAQMMQGCCQVGWRVEDFMDDRKLPAAADRAGPSKLPVFGTVSTD